MNTGINQANQQPLIKQASRSLLTSNVTPKTTSLTKFDNNIFTLNSFEVKCIMIQIAYMESDANSSAVFGDRLGKYHISDYLLKKYGYKDESGWTGLDGIDTETLFLETPAIQDKIMMRFFDDNYPKLIQTGAIRQSDAKSTVAGMLAVSYQFQDVENPNIGSNDKVANNVLAEIKQQSNFNYNAIKAQIWRDNGSQEDILGRSAGLFFNAGKYAIQNLAADYTIT
jgi:hypothetical protein